MQITTTDKLPNWLRTIIAVLAIFGLTLLVYYIARSCEPQPALTDNGQKERKEADSIKAEIKTANATAITKADNHVAKAKEAVKRANLPRKVIVDPSVEQMGVDLVNY